MDLELKLRDFIAKASPQMADASREMLAREMTAAIAKWADSEPAARKAELAKSRWAIETRLGLMPDALIPAFRIGAKSLSVRGPIELSRMNLKDEVVSINRVTKVVKGGKNMSFAALVIVGDPSEGVVGYGSGKAKEVPQAIRKGIEAAKKNLIRINLTDTTIPHQVLGRHGKGEVLLKPAPEGTGVIAGKTVRAVMTAAGVQNVLTKSLGSANSHNVIRATFDALTQLRDKAEVAALRGKLVEEL